eukprot:CAMPEP_0174821778 /NCGR_PEP_ID=MMETSP1107-20130205/9278_1 /TAXON_ID=36770 /ORGANISM="Paraphysomonas vestita, Strain GFlagA" /LENGTH=41 /DNA_ID= /DNA_START= /DNA_END= /DNA_ORIENTATION=
MVEDMKVYGQKEDFMEEEFIFGKMVEDMMVNGKKECVQVMV